MADEFDINEGLTRREALKKGAIFGGALVWAVPMVQTVGMSAAMAQTASEGICCLRIEFSVERTAGTNEVIFSGKMRNCGSTQIAAARIIYDESSDGGTTWTEGIFFQNAGLLNPGQESVRSDPRNLPDGTFHWRARGLFNCQTDPVLVDLPHTIPGATYVFGGPITIP